ncbi:MAG: hypothetical protein IPP40_05125 [bacterium]|nr:hypothetical protein [bacterium]
MTRTDGSFPDGETGLAVIVETRNIYFDPTQSLTDGYNMSARTYTADGCAPVESAHFPATGDSVQNDGNVVVEVHFNDDCDGALFKRRWYRDTWQVQCNGHQHDERQDG